MIMDLQPPEPRRRRWPFLLAWSLAAMTIVGAIFLAHAPTTPEAAVAVSTPSAAPASTPASTPAPSTITVQRIPGIPAGPSGSTQFLSVSRLPQGSIVYLDYAGTWIAVGPNDDLLIPPDSHTTTLR